MADLSERFRTIGMTDAADGLGYFHFALDRHGWSLAVVNTGAPVVMLYLYNDKADDWLAERYDTPEDAAAACEWLVAVWMHARWESYGFEWVGDTPNGTQWERHDGARTTYICRAKDGAWAWLGTTVHEHPTELALADFVADLLALAGEA